MFFLDMFELFHILVFHRETQGETFLLPLGMSGLIITEGQMYTELFIKIFGLNENSLDLWIVWDYQHFFNIFS